MQMNRSNQIYFPKAVKMKTGKAMNKKLKKNN